MQASALDFQFPLLWILGVWTVGLLTVTVLIGRWGRQHRSLILSTVSTMCFALSMACGALTFALRTYTRLSMEEPIARVQCSRPIGWPPQFELRYTQLTPAEQPTQTILLTGDQWMLTGDILKWHPWLHILGLDVIHKPTRITGRFHDATNARTMPHTMHELNGGTDWWWLQLYQQYRDMPGVAAVYGTGTYTFADPTREHTVYVTPSGYLVK